MEGVFMLLPPGFDAKPGFSEVRAPVDALRSALTAARPDDAVVPSTIGAQATRPGLLTQLSIMGAGLGTLPMPTDFLRAVWLMENSGFDVAPAHGEPDTAHADARLFQRRLD
jgi:hypothetical protein